MKSNKLSFLIITFLSFALISSCKNETKIESPSIEKVVTDALEFSLQQSLLMAESLRN